MRINPPAGVAGLAGVAASFIGTPTEASRLALTQYTGPGAIMLGASVPAGPMPGARLLSPRILVREDHNDRNRWGRHRRSRAVYPVRGKVNYGGAIARFGVQRPGHIHQGQDIFAPAGTPLVATRDGVVVGTGGGDNRGNWIAIYSRRFNRTYLYFHMQGPALVPAGRRVRAGQMVGRVGCTGHCIGDHLHFEIQRGRRLKGAAMDPLPLLRRWSHQRRHRRH